MAKHATNICIQAESIISVSTKPEQYDFSSILVEAEQVRVLMRCEFCQRPNREFMLLHDMLNGWIMGQVIQEVQRTLGTWKVLQ